MDHCYVTEKLWTVIHGKHNDYIHNLARNTTVIHGKQHDYIHNLVSNITVIQNKQHDYIHNLLVIVMDIIMLLSVDHCYITDKLWI
jgi:hypothetical protein